MKSSPFTHEEIRQVAGSVPTPFYLYDEATIRRNCRELSQAFDWAADFQNHFAVKATPNPAIIEIIMKEGSGVDCSSMAELLMAEALGLRGEKIIFTSNNTPLEEYRKAMHLNAVINLDDETHIDFLSEKLGMPELICFRYNPGSRRVGNAIIGNPEAAKFGVTHDQIFDCYKKARNLGASRFALHTMVASNSLEEVELVETGKMMFELAVELKDKCDIRIEMIDLGGGLGIPYHPSQSRVDVFSLGRKIQALYDEIIRPAGLHPIKLRYECGRFITGDAAVLVTRVIHQKNIYKKYVGVDACIANLMRPALYNAYHHIDVIPDTPTAALHQLPTDRKMFGDSKNPVVVDVVGSLCENNDKLAVDRPLPANLRIGDLVVFHDVGAHGHAMGGNYNGKLRSAEYLKRASRATGCWLVQGSNVVRIRRPETHADLFSTIVWPERLSWPLAFSSSAFISGVALSSGILIGMLIMRLANVKSR